MLFYVCSNGSKSAETHMNKRLHDMSTSMSADESSTKRLKLIPPGDGAAAGDEPDGSVESESEDTVDGCVPSKSQNAVDDCVLLEDQDDVDDDDSCVKKAIEADTSRCSSSSKWRCESCMLLNPVQVPQCIACLAWKLNGVIIVNDTDDMGPDKEEQGKDDEVGIDSHVRHDSDDISVLPSDDVITIDAEDEDEALVKGLFFDTSQGHKKDGDKNGTWNSKAEISTLQDQTATDQWTCSRCTLVNKSAVNRCEVCEAPRRSTTPIVLPGPTSPLMKVKNSGKSHVAVIARSVSSEERWKCSHCTFVDNPSWGVLCNICSTPRPVGNRQPPKKPSVNPSGSDSGNHSKHPTVPKTTKVSTNDKVSESGRSTWLCPKCTLKNGSDKNKCTACGYMKTPFAGVSTKYSPVGDATGVWTCALCTIKNQASASVCSMCMSKRDVPLPILVPDAKRSIASTSHTVPPSGKTKNPWRCAVCTFMNKSTETNCTKCGSNEVMKEKNRSAPASTSFDQGAPPGAVCRFRRLSSQCCDVVQAHEEAEATEQWDIIVNFCKVVSWPDFLL